jgi:anti-sigma regulatory factor (Ser/Thr protein kinase)
MNNAGGLRRTAGFEEETLRSLLDQSLPRVPARATSLTFSASALRLVRQLVSATARANGLNPDRSQAFTLAVNEAATNAIRHGGGRGTVLLWTEHGHLTADVHSARPLEDPAAGRLHPEPTGLAARGLPLINYLCDLVRWSRGDEGTHIRMWIRLRG